MSTIKANGIVISEVNVGESDKILTVLLKDIGKVSVSARGAKNTKSKFLGGAQLFCYCEFVIFTGRKHYSLTQVNLIESFYSIRNDYEKLIYGNYFLEIVNKYIIEKEPSNDIMFLLLKSLSALCKDKIENKLVCNIFELKFLEMIGCYPSSQSCSDCNLEYSKFENPIFFGNHGILCSKCSQKHNSKIKINNTIVYSMNFIFENDVSNIFTFTLPKPEINILDNCTKNFIKNNLDLKFKSLDML